MKISYIDPRSRAFFDSITLDVADFPCAMTIGGEKYSGFPAGAFSVALRTESETAEKLSRGITLAAPGGLTVSIDAAFWKNYGASEWTLSFRNDGEADSAVLQDVYCCELDFSGGEPLLRGILGDHENQYKPYTHSIDDAPIYFESLSGRPTHVNFPYFNLEHGDGGTMLAIGWAGTWSAEFTKTASGAHLSARSTVGLDLPLHPGESIRTALMLAAPYYVRDEAYATNFWRRWFIDCNMPKRDASGTALEPFSACCLSSDTGLPNSDGSISERYTTWRPSLEKMYEVGAKTDYRWFDAGWYCDPEGNSVPSDWWGTVGTWVLDPEKWPGDTFRESVDFAHRHDMRTLVWFEPERVTNPEALAKNYGYNTDWAIKVPNSNVITNNIGDPDCLKWTTDRICKFMRDNRVDMYREDNNCDPGELWRKLDGAEGRCGITECRVVTAHYKMWDDIIETTKSYGGNAFCDSCASGGGRNDLESLRRGIPLLRSDSDRTSTALRLSMTTSFNRWIPFCGANTKEKSYELDATGRSDVYTWRASYLPALNVDSQFTQDPNQDFDMLLFGINEWKQINKYLLKDFYVLTPWHSKDDRTGFTAYCFFDPESGTGILLAFRMEDCPDEKLSLTLPFSRPGMTAADVDSGETFPADAGLTLTFNSPRSAKLLRLSANALN